MLKITSDQSNQSWFDFLKFEFAFLKFKFQGFSEVFGGRVMRPTSDALEVSPLPA